MNSCFVDTNLFIRYFTNDNPVLADRVELLLDGAATGTVQLVTTELVMAESIWVLESSYHLSHAQIAPLIRGILATPGMEVINGDLVGKALVLYELQNIDFVDAYIAALMEKQGIKDIYSYDRKHLSRVTTINRKEP
jgi:predicted nucleic-acid-binding protein